MSQARLGDVMYQDPLYHEDRCMGPYGKNLPIGEDNCRTKSGLKAQDYEDLRGLVITATLQMKAL